MNSELSCRYSWYKSANNQFLIFFNLSKGTETEDPGPGELSAATIGTNINQRSYRFNEQARMLITQAVDSAVLIW